MRSDGPIALRVGLCGLTVFGGERLSDVLDQAEVDALLEAADAGAVGGDGFECVFSRVRRDWDSIEIRPYDFKRPERVSKDQMRALRTLHEAFARNFGASLSGFLRTIVEVKVAACEQMTYSEFITGLPNPTCFNLIQPEGLDGQICLELSPLIIYPIIDRLLGGTSQELFIPQRPMTLIETRLISNVTNRGLAALTEAWSGIREMTFSIHSTESNPQLVQIVPPNEVVVVVGFEIKMSNRAGTMNLCLPYNVIEPVMDDLASQSWFSVSKDHADAGVGARLGSSLSRASLEVTGLLAETTITLRDLMTLQPGDLLLTETASNRPVTICVEGQKKYRAHLGRHSGKLALRVIDRVGEGD